ncbi:STAS domain-containing protein [Planococcus sp. CP5-4]|uniref:STAS domain-containing protein n=1 Tax=unclassified Planococcus (in: firmicutes) TaxID=2662419 RepID=UPI001C23543A|nr:MULTISPECIES: STAS domain-containing protein [unclassified Planococcus (in: firmicutes)]MBU9673401.1 STAS domain-containing protein [Planococcus sp. CP5-4_YE]MBV0908174.1 STAS domain-containing protein [Planococcus sp. CP5-4_UN]MBW6062235.1 STAS domain-containing protein [Planococcus sp. CP5-4]
MFKNIELQDFLLKKTKGFTEQWYETLDKDSAGVYGETEPQAIEKLKQQNYEFHELFCKAFGENEKDCLEIFHDWIIRVANDEAHLATPFNAVIKEFFRTQKQYLQLIEDFATQQEEMISHEQLNKWNQSIVDTMNGVILEFINQNTKAAERRLNAQQEMIVEMSAPVILLSKDSGLLPLIGEINTYRAKIVFEKVLQQCHEKSIERLFIDLSGVPIIDTMVAHQIFQLIEGLKIIGVRTALAGISPEIAQTAIQLGINFGEIDVYNKLDQALRYHKLEFAKN